MIIKSHIRGGHRQAAAYLQAQGKNEKIRLVEISDADASNLDDAFQNMWKVSSGSKARKPLHHISINPYKDERLTDKQVLKIVARCEEKYGYKPDQHQRVIVEHIKDGRQHFHVMWNRVSMETGKAVWPGHHWNKSKQICREMEKELGLKRPVPKRMKRATATAGLRRSRTLGRYNHLRPLPFPMPRFRPLPGRDQYRPAAFVATKRRSRRHENEPFRPVFDLKAFQDAEALNWAWENKRVDILRQFGFNLPLDFFDL